MSAHGVVAAGAQHGLHARAGVARPGDLQLHAVADAQQQRGVFEQGFAGQQVETRDEQVATQFSGIDRSAVGEGGDRAEMFRLEQRDLALAPSIDTPLGCQLGRARSGPVAKNEAGVAKRQQIVVTPETANLDLEKDKDQIEIVDRFSDSYFAIVKANSIAENQMLSQQRDGEQLLIKLRGKNYLVR